ncbi:MAG: divalent cation tolerance protein CutA [Candidatus Eisenbacteria bacterium]|nr:divalent cation tolerance protein CutA [Candidatus Eisenbacteria bacterium]
MQRRRSGGHFVQVQTTFDDRDEALALVRAAVGRRLAACGQVVGPIESVYHWRGAVEEAQEWLCLLKTTRELAVSLTLFIETEHSYEVPEVIVVPVLETSDAYGEWIDEETSA